ncbi:MAG TPA: hypothetical protein VM143_18335 [Acidimicrobiales bacterium]|nr:hypothetical protein [Acidimicrobiales bacterium]
MIDTNGPAAPPRRNGELVFEAPWQGRAFGLCVAILEREGLEWDAFRSHLVAAIEADPAADYYDAFGLALDAFVTDLGLA